MISSPYPCARRRDQAAQDRNYDFRYAWIRDQCFVGRAAATIDGGLDVLGSSVAFVAERLLEDGDHLAPAYTTRGTPVPAEFTLGFPGYPGGNAVAGNHAAKQFQLDAFGESLSMFAVAAGQDCLDAEGWRAATVAVEAIASRLTCVAGINSICAVGAPTSLVGSWTSLADSILADTAKSCVHPTGRWQRSPNDDRVDAALLLPALYGATRPSDPRTLLTLRAVADDLTSDGFVYRFKPDERPLGEAEGAFLLCVFAMALAALQQNDIVAAVRWFERGRSACGPAGLFTEEFDVQQRQLRGNLPQAFVHAIFLETAATLGDALSVAERT